ncbi:DNA polymerase III subunit alpha [Bacillus sp. HMF5848]|uniref:DNA polymerase III subunit alpha n=1 Tax=Bacillus sp. HMF5848 TaxID=2495421 RepID=UPI000F7A1C58|nr:DNA polymerase III subunit alpha [Bacillus sp. HMF5848]RSK28141.1 DNA polymerase III subunit alpha [Bacillus sp. HMF5848]
MTFVHLHVHSCYSLLSSSIRIEQLVKACIDKNFSAVAITDENVMYGAVPFYKACVKQGIKPIIGLTLSVADEWKSDAKQSYPLVLLAKNNIGYKHLVKLSSAFQVKAQQGIPKKWLAQYAEGLIAITPGSKGIIETLVDEQQLPMAKQAIEEFKAIYKDDFYISIQNHGLEIEQKRNNNLFQLAKELDVKLVATNNVQYLSKEDAEVVTCLRAIKQGVPINDATLQMLPSNEFDFKSESEMKAILNDYPDALANTVSIASQCNVTLEFDKMLLPKFPVSEHKDAHSYLQTICKQGLIDRDVQTPDYEQRLQYELSIIQRTNFSDYFLIVWDFMKFAHEQGILTGPGRGSAAGSLVAYVLKITDVDPLKHGLLFERFLNPERITMPDIDIDFPDNRRDDMIQYVKNKYGDLHVAQIITYGTFGAKAAIRDVARVLGASVREADYLTKLVPSTPGLNLQQAIDQSPRLAEHLRENTFSKRIIETAQRIEGLIRHTSTHAAGVVISEEPLPELIPIQEGHNDVYLTQYPMEILENLGLLKIDFLGLRNLTLLEEICKYVQRQIGKRFSLESIPIQDQQTFELLSRGDTTGIFQLESEGMRKVLMRLQPTEFEDIVAVNALYRPGPMENIPIYIDRKHEIQQVEYPHPDLKPILENTYGVIVYQEQIMQIASKIAGFSLGEADLLRRAVGKKKKDVLDKERQHFVQGCLRNGYDMKVGEQLYDLIVRFANYGFNRSHAVAYSMIAYQLAYLKAHYPVSFLAALLSSVLGNEAKISLYIREAKYKGIKILPPSINKSGYGFTVEREGIRFGLAAVKSVGAAALRNIFQQRKVRPFHDLYDLCLRTDQKHVNRRTLESLVFSGSLDEFSIERGSLLASLDIALEHAELFKPKDEGQIGLFEDDGGAVVKPKYVEVEPLRQDIKLSFEKESLGFYLSDHPTNAYERQIKQHGGIPIIELLQLSKQTRIKTGVYVHDVKVIRTKKGEQMAFLVVSDETADMNAILFPDAFTKFSQLLQPGEVCFLEGAVDERDGQKQFIIKNCMKPNELPDLIDKVLYVKIDSETNATLLNSLKTTLQKHPGTSNVFLHYSTTKRTVKLSEPYTVALGLELIEELKLLLGAENVFVK